MSDVCPTCGKSVTGLDREIRFKYPQPIADIVREDPESKRFSIALGGDFVRLDYTYFFVRVLLPVTLDIGHEFRFGVWLTVSEKQAQHLWDVWDKQEYVDTEFTGHLANLVPPWNEDVMGAKCSAKARDQNGVPFIVSSTDESLSNVLATPWPVHECEAAVEQVWG